MFLPKERKKMGRRYCKREEEEADRKNLVKVTREGKKKRLIFFIAKLLFCLKLGIEEYSNKGKNNLTKKNK